jgi:hypothetical protein
MGYDENGDFPDVHFLSYTEQQGCIEPMHLFVHESEVTPQMAFCWPASPAILSARPLLEFGVFLL